MSERSQAWLILVLVGAYLVQGFADLPFGVLDDWQVDESYRRWSGLGVVICVALQVVLALLRKRSDAERSRQLRRLHRVLGVVALGALFLHSTSPGYGLLLGLGLLLPAQVVVGAFSPPAGDRRNWRRVHTLLACLLVGATGLHVWMVFAWS